jgi:hypothetical protein
MPSYVNLEILWFVDELASILEAQDEHRAAPIVWVREIAVDCYYSIVAIIAEKVPANRRKIRI